MILPRRRLVTAALLLVLEAVTFALFVTESLWGAVAAVGLTCGSLWVHLVLHECGHLVAAKLLRLPVVAVRIAPFTGWRNEVVVRLPLSAPSLKLRMVLFYLGGPLANLCGALVLFAATELTSSALARLALLGAAGMAALLGVANLVPGSSPRSDGRNLLRWLRTPTATVAALRAAYFQEEVRRTLRAISHDPVGDGDDPWRLLAAFQRRLNIESAADLIAAAERLAALTRADGTDPAVAAAIAEVLTIQFGSWYLYDAAVNDAPVPHHEVLEIVELAELAIRLQPGQLSARVAMSLAHLLNHRPEQARSLLLDIRPDGDQPDLCGVAFVLRAIAECYLGNRAEADRWLHAAGPRCPQLTRLAEAIQAADPLPPLFAAAPHERTAVA
ncbi:hypothetical protein AB0J74_18560 [Asanoa sp. NPDC049573]|uniref:hypothetical protein n=1 Tax=Asanoa sp. NPDC049573 TaxID=3155396 RepID=UPI00343C415C